VDVGDLDREPRTVKTWAKQLKWRFETTPVRPESPPRSVGSIPCEPSAPLPRSCSHCNGDFWPACPPFFMARQQRRVTLPLVPGESFFMATAALGVSLVGFTGLMAAVDPNTETRPAIAAWRIHNVVQFGFLLTILGFGTIALHAISGDVTLTIRLVSGAAAIWSFALWWRATEPSPAWPDDSVRRWRRPLVLSSSILIATNVAFASVGGLQLAFVLLLYVALDIFRQTIKDHTTRRSEGG
jgi:hypothetical protein